MSVICSLRPLLLTLVMLGAAVEGGAPAMPLTQAQHAPLLAVTQAGQRLIALGDHGVVVLSDDGLTWRQARGVPVDGLLTALSFVDAKQGWAVGHGGVLLRTADGGDTWALQQRLEGHPVLLSVWFENARHGIVVGSYGYAAETWDGGRNWKHLQVGAEGDENHLNHIFPGPGGSLFIAAEMGNAYRSLNRGGTWQTLDTGVSGSLWSGLGMRDGRLLLVGMSGRVLLSENLGDRWHEVDSGSQEAITAITQLADGRVVLAGNGGLVAIADVGLERFTASVRDDRLNLAALAPLTDGRVLLFGPTGVVPQ